MGITLAERFKAVFGVDIRPYACFHGFDILKFDDEFVKPGEDESTADACRRRFGDASATLMRELCKVHHPTAFYEPPR